MFHESNIYSVRLIFFWTSKLSENKRSLKKRSNEYVFFVSHYQLIFISFLSYFYFIFILVLSSEIVIMKSFSFKVTSSQIIFISKIMNLSLIDFEHEHIIKYLISSLRFVISENIISYSNTNESLIKSTKLITNLNIVKTFCEIARDITVSKRWKNDKFKIITSIATFLLMMNKKFKMNFIMKYSNIKNMISSYSYVTIHEFTITKENILFCSIMITSLNRRRIATWMTQNHIIWKYHAHISIKKSAMNMFKEDLCEKNIWWRKH